MMFEEDALLNQLIDRINPTPIVPSKMPGGDQPCDKIIFHQIAEKYNFIAWLITVNTKV